MKKWLAFLLAALMLFSCVNIMAEESIPDNAMVLFGMAIDPDVLGDLMPMVTGVENNENTQQIIEAFLTVLNKAYIVAAVDAGESESGLDLYLNDQRIGIVIGRIKDDKMQIASSLFPSYVITADKSLFDEVTKSLPAMLDKDEVTASAAAITESMDALAEKLKPVSEAPEKGVFTFDGADFDTCTLMHLPASQLLEAAKKALEQLMANEEIKAAMQTADMGDIQAAIAEIDPSEAGDTALDIRAYTCEEGAAKDAGNVYYTLEMPVDEDENLNIAAGTVNDTFGLHLMIGSNAFTSEEELRAAADAGGNAMALDVQIQTLETATLSSIMFVASGAQLGMDVLIGEKEEDQSVHFEVDLYLMKAETPLLSLRTILYPGRAEMMTDFDDSEMKEIPLEALMEGGEAANGLLQDIQSNGLGLLMSLAQEAMPTEMETLMKVLTPAPAVEAE